MNLNSLFKEMVSYFEGDPKRIQHFVKVHSFAKLIGEIEGLDSDKLFILEIAAFVHDIGIKQAELKYGNCNGKLQEQEGPIIAEQMLQKLGFHENVIDRVSFLVGHHHTYTNIDDLDYQILVEADFLVNFFEDRLDKIAIKTAYEKIFKTEAGRNLCRDMFKFI